MNIVLTKKSHLFPLIGILILTITIPIYFLFFPSDEKTYSAIAQKILSGGILYKNAVDSKPPLIYYTYALIYKVFGSGNLLALKVTAIITLYLTAVLFYYSAIKIFSEKTASLVSVIFSIAIVTGYYQDYLAVNTEIFMNLFMLLSLFFFISFSKTGSLTLVALAGLSAGIGFLYRFPGGVYLAGYGIYIISRYRMSVKTILYGILLGVSFSIPFLLFALYFYQNNSFDDFIFWCFKYNSLYINTGRGNIHIPHLIGRIALTLVTQIHIIILSSIAVYIIIKKRLFKNLLYLLISVLVILNLYSFSLGDRFYGHYFLQVIPSFCLLTGILFDSGYNSQNRAVSFYINKIAIFMIIHAMIFTIVNFSLKGLTLENDRRNYKEITEYIEANTPAGTPVFLWSADKMILFHSNRTFATRFVHNNYVTGQIWGTKNNLKTSDPELTKKAIIPEIWPMLIEDFLKEKPQIVISSDNNFRIDRFPVINEYIKRDYRQPQKAYCFLVYLRKK